MTEAPKKSSMKFPMMALMIATAGLALSMNLHAEENPNQPQAGTIQGSNAAVDSAKDMLSKTFSFTKSTIGSALDSAPVQAVKGAASDAYKSAPANQIKDTVSDAYNSAPVRAVKGGVSDAYHSAPVQAVKGGVTDVYNSEPVTKVKNVAGDVYSAGKTKVQDATQSVVNYKQNALASQGVNENSTEEEKKAAYAAANGNAAKSFFNNLFDKTKELTSAATQTVQNATQPSQPDEIGQLVNTSKVRDAYVAPAQDAVNNMHNMRNTSTKPAKKAKIN